MTPSLPQSDPDPAARQAELQAARAAWRFDPAFLAPVPMLLERGTAHPSIWQAALGWEVGEIPKAAHPPGRYLVERFLSLRTLRENMIQTRAHWNVSAFSSVEDYRRLYTALPRPAAMEPWPDDASFARQRVAGVNPVLLRKVDAVPANLAVTDATVAGLLPPGRLLADVARSGQLMVLDYAMLEGIPLGPFGDGEKYVGAPLALFFVDERGRLAPLAIQLGPSPKDPVVTPRDNPKAWLLAKTFLQVADINHHELGTHLCRTHFILEGFAVAAARQLPERHPVAVLLKPHLRILIFNNFEGRELLLSPDGLATRLLAGGLAGSTELVKRSYAGHVSPPVEGRERPPVAPWTFETWDLPTEIASRGLADTARLPDYPFRDDGLLVWEAVGTFVRRYLRLYYTSDADVVADREVQAFAAELIAPDGAHVPGLQPPRTIEELAVILTRIVFTCGPLHASVNFPQYDDAGFIPNLPGSAYARPPQELHGLDDATLDALLLQVLPPPHQTVLQVQTVTELTSYQFDKLGHYEAGDFTDQGALAVVADFQQDLQRVAATITARNTSRVQPYPWFLPERIPNSTSI
jgi:arachidonate 15-lipoxygenase